MPKIELRYQKVSDAKRFFEILNNPNFLYFSSKPKSIEEEREFLRKTQKNKRNNYGHNFTILYDKKMVGGAGIKVNQHRKHIGEIGYFIDYDYWNKGIATKVVKILEKIGKDLGIRRFEIVLYHKNKGSMKVALKNNYKREAVLRKFDKVLGKYRDMVLYSKIKG